MGGLFGGLCRLLHGGEQEVGCLELILAHSLAQEGLGVVLAREEVQLRLCQLEGSVFQHSHLVQGIATLVSQGVGVPDTVFFDLEQIEDFLETSLQKIHCAGVLKVFFFNLLGLLLSTVNVIHNFFELNSARLKLTLRSVTNTIGSVSMDLLLDISNFFSKLLLLTAQLTHIVVE